MSKRITSWGYKIDYDKEIEADMERIETLTICARLVADVSDGERAAACETYKTGRMTSDCFLIPVDTRPRRLAMLGLTEEQYAGFWTFVNHEQPGDEFWPEGVSATDRPYREYAADYESVYEAIDSLLGYYMPTEEEVRQGLKKAKADLARHKRNKAKNGG